MGDPGPFPLRTRPALFADGSCPVFLKFHLGDLGENGVITGLSLRLDSPGYLTRYFSRTCPDEDKRPTLEILYTR